MSEDIDIDDEATESPVTERPATDDEGSDADAGRPTDGGADPHVRLDDERDTLVTQLVELERGEEALDFDDNFADSGQVAAEQGENRVLAMQLREQLDDVERAISKLDDGTYGACEICGATIGDARLEAMPATRFCIEHAGLTVAAMAKATHLVKRFFFTAWPKNPSKTDDAWARSQLLPGEIELWDRMKPCDRRHSVGVARRVDDALGPEATRPVLAAALLHDVGKIEANFGAYRRAVATASAIAVKHDEDIIKAWTRTRGFIRRTGLYLQHPKIGGDLLGLAGSDPLTEAWTRQHHLPESEWTVPMPLARALKDADDD